MSTAPGTGGTPPSRPAPVDGRGRTGSDTRPAGRRWGLRERLTTAWAAARLEWWLEWYGAPWRSCRTMRQELVANLRAAHADGTGLADGLREVGDLRELGRAAAEGPRRFRWERGLVVASLVLAVAVLAQFALVLVYAGGLLAAGGGDGRLLGGPVSATETAGTVVVEFGVPWTPLLLAGVAFLLVSRPWHALGAAAVR